MKLFKNLSKYFIYTTGTLSLLTLTAIGGAGLYYQQQVVDTYNKAQSYITDEQTQNLLPNLKNNIIPSIKTNLPNIKQIIIDLKNDVPNTIEEVKKSVVDIQNQVNSVSKTIDELEPQIATINNVITQLKKEVDDKANSIGNIMNQDIKKIQEEINNLQTQFNNLTKTYTEAKKFVADGKEFLKQAEELINNQGSNINDIFKDGGIADQTNNTIDTVDKYIDQADSIVDTATVYYNQVLDFFEKTPSGDFESYYHLAASLMFWIPASVLGIGIISSFVCWLFYKKFDGYTVSRNHKKQEQELTKHVEKIIKKHPQILDTMIDKYKSNS